MDHQTSMRNGPADREEGQGVLGGVGSFGNNLIQLTTLQAHLFRMDFAEVSRTAGPALLVLILAILAIPSALVAGTIGLALWIAESGALSTPMAFLAVAAGLLVMTALASVVATFVIRKSLVTFRRSGEELERNMAWVQTVLTHSGR